ncbi:MAG: outer membrane protein transport protein [Flavobacteriales bacterium]|nr:outer membrane protein transport protein [Flavobacteriales bacterium]
MRRIILSLLLGAPAITIAGGFQLNVQGLKAIAMGGAFTGVASDATTVFFNPAGMSNLHGHNFTFGVNIIDPHVSLQTPETANIDQTSGIGTPFHFYYSGQINEKLNFGFLVNNQFGSSSSFEDNWQGRNIIQNISLKTFMFQPTISYKIHDKISIGAGFVYALGSFSTEKAVPLASGTTDEGKAHLEGNGDGVGFNIGVYSQFLTLGDETKNTKFAIGLDYRSKMPVDLSNGEATFTNIPVSLQGTFPAKTGFVSKITLPSVFTVGFSIKHTIAEKWSLEFAYDMNLTGWTSYDTLAFDFKNNDTPDSKQIQDWDNVLTHRLGLDFTYLEKYSVRIGLYQDNTPMKDNLISPHLPGVTQVAYTAGLGYKFSDKVSIDFSFIRQSASRDDVSLAQFKVEDGNYVQQGGEKIQTGEFAYKFNRKVNVYGLAVNIKFGDKKKKEEEAPSIN